MVDEIPRGFLELVFDRGIKKYNILWFSKGEPPKKYI
jgi:hypothetical protein